MNKAQLIDPLSAQLGSKKAATDAVEAVLDTITRAVAKGEKVAITGFGSFEKVARPARTGRNPRTGERVKVKKTAVPKFRPGRTSRTSSAAPRSCRRSRSPLPSAATGTTPGEEDDGQEDGREEDHADQDRGEEDRSEGAGQEGSGQEGARQEGGGEEDDGAPLSADGSRPGDPTRAPDASASTRRPHREAGRKPCRHVRPRRQAAGRCERAGDLACVTRPACRTWSTASVSGGRAW